MFDWEPHVQRLQVVIKVPQESTERTTLGLGRGWERGPCPETSKPHRNGQTEPAKHMAGEESREGLSKCQAL